MSWQSVVWKNSVAGYLFNIHYVVAFLAPPSWITWKVSTPVAWLRLTGVLASYCYFFFLYCFCFCFSFSFCCYPFIWFYLLLCFCFSLTVAVDLVTLLFYPRLFLAFALLLSGFAARRTLNVTSQGWFRTTPPQTINASRSEQDCLQNNRVREFQHSVRFFGFLAGVLRLPPSGLSILIRVCFSGQRIHLEQNEESWHPVGWECQICGRTISHTRRELVVWNLPLLKPQQSISQCESNHWNLRRPSWNPGLQFHRLLIFFLCMQEKSSLSIHRSP